MSASFDRFRPPQASDEFYPCEECRRLCHHTALSQRPGFENFCQPCANALAAEQADDETNEQTKGR